ncbi:MAG: pentapeptide repeat-containing protein, partial [Microcystis sp. M53600_WE12]|nr:pentapeptide repeat-containing protein [Microcystis sp. M53600_WE12]
VNFRASPERDGFITDLTGASFRGADLSYADLRGAILEDVDLTDADLTWTLF